MLSASYVAPDVSPAAFGLILASTKTLIISPKNHKVLISGDTNVPGISRIDNTLCRNSFYNSKKCHSLLEFTSFNCMQQLKSTENCCGNVLDIGLTNIDAVSVMPSNVHLVVPEPSFNCFLTLVAQKRSILSITTQSAT